MADIEIDLPDWLYEHFQRLAALEGIPVDELVNRVVRQEISRIVDDESGRFPRHE